MATRHNRLAALEERISTLHPEKITVILLADDPDDPNFVIIDPHSKNPTRMSKAELQAQDQAAKAAGETIIVISYQDQLA